MFFKLYFTKIKLSFKGFKLGAFKQNEFLFNFGKSHLFLFKTLCLVFKRLTRFVLYFYGLSFFFIKKHVRFFKKHSPVNIFTGKGMVFVKNLYYRKIGKVSLYF